MIRLGGPVFMSGTNPAPGPGESHGSGHEDVQSLARKHREKGFRAAYAPQVSVADSQRIRDIRKAFEAEDVVLAEVQCWVNLLDPDPPKARANRERVAESLAVADEIGARCALDTVGSFRPESPNHHDPRNFSEAAFEAAVDIAREIIDSVKPKTAVFAYEVLSMHVVDSPEVIARLIEAVDRKQFGVHMDLANLINSPRAYWNSGAIIRRAVSLFGDRIVSAHAKDIQMEDASDNIRLREVQPGQGNLDYRAYLSALHGLTRDVPLMMEHLPNEYEYDEAAAYIRSQAVTAGVSL
jgi:sugar phosphate isomerase/epimerase